MAKRKSELTHKIKGVQLSESDALLVEALRAKLGIQRFSDLVRLGLRRLAEAEGIQNAA